MLPNCDGEQAGKLSERLRQSIAEVPMNAEGKELQVTCSFGIASTGAAAGVTVAALVHAADEALYLAKEAGRNCVRVAPLLADGPDLSPNPSVA